MNLYDRIMIDHFGKLLIALALILAIGLTLVFRAVYIRENSDDLGNFCEYGVIWRPSDNGACLRECARAALAADDSSFEYATNYCVRRTCPGYRRVCEEGP